MAELIPVPPIDSDISLKALAALSHRLSDINLTPLLVYLVDLVDSSTLPWLAEQLSLVGDGWELAESDEVRRTLIKGAIELHRYKGTPWSIREIVRRMGFGEVELVEGIGAIRYDGKVTHNGIYLHGHEDSWAVYKVILQHPITNDQAAMLRKTLDVFAPARCELASLEYQSVPIRYNNAAKYDGNYNYGSG